MCNPFKVDTNLYWGDIYTVLIVLSPAFHLQSTIYSTNSHPVEKCYDKMYIAFV